MKGDGQDECQASVGDPCMFDSDVSEEDLVRIPRLTSGCDPSVLKLSPAEGFLLSRIDGQT